MIKVPNLLQRLLHQHVGRQISIEEGKDDHAEGPGHEEKGFRGPSWEEYVVAQHDGWAENKRNAETKGKPVLMLF